MVKRVGYGHGGAAESRPHSRVRGWAGFAYFLLWLGGWTGALLAFIFGWGEDLQVAGAVGPLQDHNWLIPTAAIWATTAGLQLWMLFRGHASQSLGSEPKRLLRDQGHSISQPVAAMPSEGASNTKQCDGEAKHPWIDKAERWYAALFLSLFLTFCTMLFAVTSGMFIFALIRSEYGAAPLLVIGIGALAVGWLWAAWALEQVVAGKSLRSIRMRPFSG